MNLINRYAVSVVCALICFLGASAQGNIRGDINGDGKLTLADAEKLCDMLVGNDNTAQNSFNTNFDKNNSRFSICDVTSLVKMVNNRQGGGLDVGIGGWGDGGEDFGGTVYSMRRSASDSNVAEVLVPVSYDSFNGFQLDIKVPDGCKLVPYGDSNVKLLNTGGNVVLKQKLSGSTLKLAGYTTDNKALTAGSDFLSFRLTSDGGGFPHVFSVEYSNVELSKTADCDAETYTIPAYSYAEYMLTFKADGNTVQSGYCEAGSTLASVAPDAPAKAGHTFSGWGDMPQSMPAHDLTLNAVYTPIAVSSITLSTTQLSLVIGESEAISAVVSPDDALDKTVTWTSSDAAVATVVDGNVTAVGAGSAVISAKCGDAHVTCAVTVGKKSQTIAWEQTFTGLKTGDVIDLNAKASSGLAVTYAVTKGADIVSVNGTKLTVNSYGDFEVTASQAGDEVYAAAESVAKAGHAVPSSAESLILSASALSLTIGESSTLTATVTPDDAADKSVVWTTSDSKVATVVDGKVSAVSEGTAVITAKSGNATASCTVTVSKKTQEIVWTQDFTELKQGDKIELTASATSGLDVVYTVTRGDDIASIDGSELSITGSGEFEITASQSGNDVFEAAESISITIISKKENGINDVESDSVILSINGNKVSVKGLSDGDEYMIFDLSGRLIYKGNDSSVDLLHNTCYVVVIANRSYKIRVN